MSTSPAVLVTGGAGYIGAHCCRALQAAGCTPDAVLAAMADPAAAPSWIAGGLDLDPGRFAGRTEALHADHAER